MRLSLRRSSPPDPIVAADATPPTYASVDHFIHHALRYPMNGWFEPLGGRAEVGVVDRCLQLNASQLANMTLRYRHSSMTNGFEPMWAHDPDPAWYPNGIQEAVFAIVWSVYGHGDAFLWVTSRYETGYPRTWTVLDPVTMRVAQEGGTRSYQSNNTELDPADVLQIQRDPRGGLRGRSALAAYWSNLQSAYQAEAYAADVYQASGVNRMALKVKGRIDSAQAADIQAQWVAAVSKRMGSPAVLDDRVELLEALSVSPKDLMLIESRQWDSAQIAAAFGVPAVLLNLAPEGGLVYQNPATLAELWWRTELMPTAGRIAAALSRWLPRGHWVEFDPTAAIRPDLPTMVNTFSKALQDGAVTVAEYRAFVFDLPPLTDDTGEADDVFEEPGAHGTAGAPSMEVVPA